MMGILWLQLQSCNNYIHNYLKMGNMISACESLCNIGKNDSIESPVNISNFEKTVPQEFKNEKVRACFQRFTNNQKLKFYRHKASGSGTLNLVQKEPMRHIQTWMVYEGSWDNQTPEGVGMVYFDGGEFYYGQIHKGMAHGIGLFVMINGASYYGNFDLNKAEGSGEYQNQGGKVIFKGNWKNSKPETGKYNLPNQIVVEFEQLNYGTIKKPNQDHYQGGINKFFLPHGKGTRTFHSKTCKSYTGDWESGQFHGKGVSEWTNGSKYQGQYKKNNKHGYGVYWYARTGNEPVRKYEGEWFEGEQHGQGKILKDGKIIYEGEFVHGRIKQRIKQESVQDKQSSIVITSNLSQPTQ